MEPVAPWIVVAALLALVGVLLVLWRRAVTRIGRENAARQDHARRGEDRAERLLARAGFEVVDRQVTGRWTLWVDGEPLDVHSRADLLVRRGAQRFVAEVKTGNTAPNPRTPATRRQLLEYLHAFDVHGVLLVDVDDRAIRRVEFPVRWPGGPHGRAPP